MGFFKNLTNLTTEKGRYQQVFGTAKGEALYDAIKSGRDNKSLREALRMKAHATLDKILDEKWKD